MVERADAIVGCLLGTAVGDAVGLPCEGLSRRRQRRLFGEIGGCRLLFGRGMVSDDTEHAVMTAQALLASGGDVKAFRRALARELRLWSLTLPAGAGRATLRATSRLWAGVSPERSGVTSAGNGAAMRSPILGVCLGHDLHRLREVVRVCTRITHTDPRAEQGALAVALAAHLASTGFPDGELATRYLAAIAEALSSEGEEMVALVGRAVLSAASGSPTPEFADALGPAGGVSGYIYHTVPVALHAWLRHPRDLRAAVLDAVHCGGDSDTVAAVTGGIVGAGVGRAGIPEDWLASLLEWPMTVRWIETLGERLAAAGDAPGRPLSLPLAGRMLRGAFFTSVVLAHGFRRLLPPY